MERLTKRFTDGSAYCDKAIENVGIIGINYPTYVGEAVNLLAYYEDIEEQGYHVKFPFRVGDQISIRAPICFFESGCDFEDCKEWNESNERLLKTSVESIHNEGCGWYFILKGFKYNFPIWYAFKCYDLSCNELNLFKLCKGVEVENGKC